ncbi:hypothetical protein [Vibrio parahaemolyticus]|uniref:hypothetical protein n=1 Tax=Vibrio parahaemolyticus TaxID=670 RepID=UPI000636BD76|nr:hypothetical protein [Vibrio parahaemolyticus]CDT91352.1 conserved membrane hypothetical protein [Vibrio diabolicus]
MAQEKNPPSKLTKWFCYTVIIGLIPIILRMFASWIIEGVNNFSAADFIAFGFVLHISIINELEHITGDDNWKSVGNIFSIGGIVLCSGLMFALLVVESGYNKINVEALTNSSMALAICSFIICWIIFYRLNKKAVVTAPTSANKSGATA